MTFDVETITAPNPGPLTLDGTNTYVFDGTVIDPGGTAHTKGSWTEIVSSTTEQYNGFFLSHSRYDWRITGSIYGVFDIGFGASSSEVVICANLPYYRQNSGYLISPFFTPIFPIKIPAGTRIAARAAGSNTSAGQREIDLVVHAIR